VSAAGFAAARLPRDPLLVFTVTVVGCALLLQRFGLPAGAKAINLVGPVCLLLALRQLLRGVLAFHPTRLACFLACFVCATVGVAYNNIIPAPFTTEPSIQSTAQFFLMTAFATLSFTQTVREADFFRVVTGCLLIVAVAGILQFAAQFIGLGLFSFRGIIPDRLLFEDGYNLQIPFGIGSLMKSNGFFLLEPSIYSQFMAIGIVMEVLTARRKAVLALFATGILLSGAGTGWLVLGAFVVSAAFSLGLRGAVLALGIIALAAALAGLTFFVAPDVLSVLSDRADEISRPSTSGHLRFITPFWVLSDVLARAPAALMFGLGGGVSERLVLPYEYNVNTPIKITLEYGLPAFVFYVGAIMLGRKSPVQRALVAPALMLLMFTGGYQQFPPILFFVLLVVSVARLEPTPR